MARPTVPTPEEHARLWAKLSTEDRRAIFRAVNKGEALQDRKRARLAVGTARRQIRYWQKAWLVGPLMGLIRLPEVGPVIITAVMGTLLMGALSAFRIRRATAAEQANLERLGG